MNWKKIFAVVRREYVERIRSELLTVLGSGQAPLTTEALHALPDGSLGQADRLADHHVLAPLVLGPAQPADAQDQDLALTRRQGRFGGCGVDSSPRTHPIDCRRAR